MDVNGLDALPYVWAAPSEVSSNTHIPAKAVMYIARTAPSAIVLFLVRFTGITSEQADYAPDVEASDCCYDYTDDEDRGVVPESYYCDDCSKSGDDDCHNGKI